MMVGPAIFCFCPSILTERGRRGVHENGSRALGMVRAQIMSKHKQY